MTDTPRKITWSQQTSDRLQLLMNFLLKGVWGLPEEMHSLNFPVYKPLSQRQLAEAMETYQGTIGEWKRGGRPSVEGQAKLSRYCRQSLENLQDYLEGRMSLVEFCRFVNSSLQIDEAASLQVNLDMPALSQILNLLPRLQVHERADLMHQCIDSWLRESGGNPNP